MKKYQIRIQRKQSNQDGTPMYTETMVITLWAPNPESAKGRAGEFFMYVYHQKGPWSLGEPKEMKA